MNKHWVFKGFLRTLNFPSISRCFCSSSSFSLKNVTKSNFESSLNDLRRHVKDADFVAIDLEMTGITSAPWRESFEFDRFDIRYLKVKDSAEKFAVVQFGVCPFRWDAQQQSFIAHPYNFYVFPRQEITGANASCEFLCQTTSIDFLAKYQFDFNMCVREGVSYLSRSQEEAALKCLDSRCNNELFGSSSSGSEVADMQLTRMSDVLFAKRLKKNITAWRDELLFGGNRGSESDMSLNDSNKKFQTIFFKMRPAISLTGFTSRQLRLIQWVTRSNFKDLEYVRATDGTSSPQHLIVYIDSKNDRDRLMKEVQDYTKKDAELKIKAAIGFRHVIDLLSSEQKLIVGHNCFLDIAHIYRKFIGPLPLTSQEYAASIQEYFPHIVDTKVLLNTNHIFRFILKKSRTSLSKAFALLCPHIASGVKAPSVMDKGHSKVEVQVDDKRSLNWNSGAKHEAGYDAFMTGCVFAQACNILNIDFNKNEPSVHLGQHDKLQNYTNLLYLSWTSGDIIDLRTGEPATVSVGYDILKSRYPKILFPNIVMLWGFPSNFKPSEIKQCFCQAFGPESVTSIYVVDQTAVFIQLRNEELVSRFLEVQKTLEGSHDTISAFHPLAKILEGGRTRAATYEAYKEMCSSPISQVLFADQAEAVGIKGKTKISESVLVGVKRQKGASGVLDNQVLLDSLDETEMVKLNSGELDSFSPLEAQLIK